MIDFINNQQITLQRIQIGFNLHNLKTAFIYLWKEKLKIKNNLSTIQIVF